MAQLAQYWPSTAFSTGPVLAANIGPVPARYNSAQRLGIGPVPFAVLAQYRASNGPVLNQYNFITAVLRLDTARY